jgi:prepilin-type processing-associated H-X9-DG protein
MIGFKSSIKGEDKPPTPLFWYLKETIWESLHKMQTNRAGFDRSTASWTLYCSRFEGGCPTIKEEVKSVQALYSTYYQVLDVGIHNDHDHAETIKTSGRMSKHPKRKMKKWMHTKIFARLIWTEPRHPNSLNLFTKQSWCWHWTNTSFNSRSWPSQQTPTSWVSRRRVEMPSRNTTFWDGHVIRRSHYYNPSYESATRMFPSHYACPHHRQ